MAKLVRQQRWTVAIKAIPFPRSIISLFGVALQVDIISTTGPDEILMDRRPQAITNCLLPAAPKLMIEIFAISDAYG